MEVSAEPGGGSTKGGSAAEVFTLGHGFLIGSSWAPDGVRAQKSGQGRVKETNKHNGCK
jgi:hypothetical protein